jgi:hypothetical protein
MPMHKLLHKMPLLCCSGALQIFKHKPHKNWPTLALCIFLSINCIKTGALWRFADFYA